VPDTGGGAPGWVGTLADVTAEVGAEAAMAAARDEATEASRTKSDFLANMSHEIRTPMNGVIGMTDLLLETDLDPSQRDYAQAVRNSGEALLTIINDILDFSKVEVGKLDVEAIEFALRSVAEDVTTLLAREAHAKGLELILAIDRDVPRIVVGDPGRVRQVLTNLIGNAIKFTHRGEVVVRVGATPGAEHEALIRFEISDTGDGIAADKLDLVFQPFVQADTSTSRRYGGTGLGLAISSHLVALMGGDCGVESELGSGSTFWFTVRAPYRQASTIPDLVAPGALAGVTALVVDGNATHRTVVSEYLSEWEIEVSGAASADAALAMMRAAVTAGQPFGLVLASGSALAGAVAAAQDLTSPLIVMTQIDDPHDGAHVTISKPVRRGALLRAVRDALHVAPPRSTAGRVKRDEAKRTGRGRLLVAEDNPINRKVAVAMLSGAGYEVDTVDDGAAAVEAATREFYDAILMDCQMPELSGYEATAQIRKLEGRDRHTPIIALTAGARREDRERCLAEGMDSYLAKPVNKEALLALVSHALKRGAPDTSSYGPMIDLAVFEELRSAGGEQPGAFLTDVIKCFIAESEPCLVDLRRVLDLRDAAAVGHYAHLLKGSCAQLGGRRLAASCERLERRALAGYLTLNRTDLEEVEVDYEDLRRALSRELEQLTKPSAAHHV
ncbi:MAG: two-component system, sensor histidine kinase and response regulator, partial [Solirubrobacteraceae bacterium]|nr:two-component system, sensor histidine kinase and response regulator [Solirubrobacteraceae bacterium]